MACETKAHSAALGDRFCDKGAKQFFNVAQVETTFLGYDYN
jgi:hypothetical protein